MIRMRTTKSYEEEVNELYKMLIRDSWSNLRSFEWRYRKIHILNSKIKNKAAQLDKEEGVYSTCTY